ncbi:MAG: acetyl-CoA carboxylase carboxyltransferase subunit alpha [Anaerosomatales bacterium]|nr:acetyl-CoA carboxylase carboxyltransferase subunit alpha [Anaerosomatales bacterium]MDT8434472.1 acetyl-CoA carboxylase carboxyltransferase subunit alpha [Anaerosomatales bacterium]
MTRRHVMEFERPLVELEAKLGELRQLELTANPELAAEVAALAVEIEALRESTYADLSAWDRVQISRHPDRPKAQDYLAAIFTDVVELHGDRSYGDDEAIVAALATIDGRRVAVLGHRKGKNTRENIARNFGMAHPEGFRKAMRIMRLAEKFGLPLVTLIDTPGAFPGIEAEERGQAWAIAESLSLLSGLHVPVIAVGIGEGGSGGALAIGFGDRLIMLENSYYSVISPEACASILHKDAGKAAEVATCLAMTATDLVGLGIVDEIIPEPVGGAHRDPGEVFGEVRGRISAALAALSGSDPDELVSMRYAKLRAVGVIEEVQG